MEKIIVFFCGFSTSYYAKYINTCFKDNHIEEQKNEAIKFLDDLEELRQIENADKIILSFVGNGKPFLSELNNGISNLKIVLKELQSNKEKRQIVFGNHYDAKFSFLPNGNVIDNSVYDKCYYNLGAAKIVQAKMDVEINSLIWNYEIIKVIYSDRSPIDKTIDFLNRIKEKNILVSYYEYNNYQSSKKCNIPSEPKFYVYDEFFNTFATQPTLNECIKYDMEKMSNQTNPQILIKR